MAEPQVNPYLRNAVLTASPEQLHLMLYDGAIRFTTQARDAIVQKQIEQAYNLITRTQRIINEMQSGLRHEVAPELCAQLAGLYGFVFGKLVDANINHDVQALDDALKVLKLQRETWVLVVEKVQQARAEGHQSSGPASTPTSTAPSISSSLCIEG
ncbi:MAG: Flagellar secretion chaperone FliS [Phycisphaerae bacterium]|nr:Flagellar secretion chaperone FliS [Phycisphaerae bacterium]